MPQCTVLYRLDTGNYFLHNSPKKHYLSAPYFLPNHFEVICLIQSGKQRSPTPVPNPQPDCLFCYDNVRDRIIDEYDSVIAILDDYPVTEGHHLIITKRHVEDYFNISAKERNDADSLMRILRNRIKEKDPSGTGFNIGVNTSASAGQTIFHVSCHFLNE